MKLLALSLLAIVLFAPTQAASAETMPRGQPAAIEDHRAGLFPTSAGASGWLAQWRASPQTCRNRGGLSYCPPGRWGPGGCYNRFKLARCREGVTCGSGHPHPDGSCRRRAYLGFN